MRVVTGQLSRQKTRRIAPKSEDVKTGLVSPSDDCKDSPTFLHHFVLLATHQKAASVLDHKPQNQRQRYRRLFSRLCCLRKEATSGPPWRHFARVKSRWSKSDNCQCVSGLPCDQSRRPSVKPFLSLWPRSATRV